MNSLYDISVSDIEGNVVKLSKYTNHVLLIVNVASRCGFTPQYKGLEELHQKFHPQGFAVLGFPCNQFGGQEPGTASEIKSFCDLNYKVSFPLFGKIDVNGPGTHPLYQHLKQACPGLLGSEAIKWNFTKFLVDKQGQVVERFAPQTSPESLESRITELLEA